MKKKKILIIALVVLLFFVLSIFVFRKIRQNNQKLQLYKTASLIGYNSGNEITQVNRCYDIFSHCGLFLFFKTDMTLESFKTQLRRMPFKETNEKDIDIYEIFTAINLGTRNKLSINETDGLGDRNQLPHQKGYRWHFQDKDGRYWTISYYPLSDNSETIKLDGQPFKTNIVGVLYQTK